MDYYRVPEQAEKYINHDLIKKHTELPVFPHGRTKLLYTFLSSKRGLSHQESELYALVTSLVQVGLDTHDLVEATAPGTNQKHNRTIQLRVLAGDYYSGRFYQLLAQAGRVEWIKILSSAICDVNRLKLNFYVKMKQLRLNAEDYLKQMVQIRSALFLSFTQIVDLTHREEWPKVLELFTKCEIIAEELERLGKPEQFHQSWAYWYLMQAETEELERMTHAKDPAAIEKLKSKYDISAKLGSMLEKHLQQLAQLVHKLESDNLIREVMTLMESFREWVNNSKVLEEI